MFFATVDFLSSRGRCSDECVWCDDVVCPFLSNRSIVVCVVTLKLDRLRTEDVFYCVMLQRGMICSHAVCMSRICFYCKL